MQGTGRFDIKEGARATGVPSLTKLRWSLPWLVAVPILGDTRMGPAEQGREWGSSPDFHCGEPL